MKWYCFSSGPGVNKAVLLKIQQEQQRKESKQHVDMSLSQFSEKMKEGWENKGYEDNEVKTERRSSGSSKEVLEKKKEESINHF